MMKLMSLCTLCFVFISYTFAQNIEITSFRATNEYQDSVYDIHKAIVLNYRETHIFLSFKDSNDNRSSYSYQLVGFDKKWHENGQNESVNYVNLFGGQYTLQVKNLNYPKKIASLTFRLEDAFWQKPWFIPMIVAYGLLVLGLILYFFRVYKLRNLIRLQEIRNEIAADLHDDVGSTLSNIGFLGEIAKLKFDKNPTEVLPFLDRIVENSKEMMQTMRGMVWAINPDNDNARDFIEKVKSFVDAMLSNREMKLYFKNEIPEKQVFSIEQQRHLFLIFKEIVHNIAKHSKAANVSFVIKKHEHWLWVKVTDDGVGFDTNNTLDGNGLANLQKRIAQLDGKIEVASQIGQGTTIKLMMPF